MSTPELFPPTLREVMLRPRWLGVLLLSLVIAAVFAFLGQWQLGRAIDTDPTPPGATEEVLPLDEVLLPGEYLVESQNGQRVETGGVWIGGDFIVVAGRYHDGVEGYWVTGQLRVAEKTSVAVALGWAGDREKADAAAEALESKAAGTEARVIGRIISDEGVQLPPRSDPLHLERMSPAALLGRWHDIDQLAVYRPYLASVAASEGLTDISSPAPEEGSPVNWLNVFYAVEWAVFAGFAFYIWYRLAKDAWERDVEAFEKTSGE